MPNHSSSIELRKLRDQNTGTFSPGLYQPGSGRRRGVTNKIPRNLKLSIIDAAVAYGSDGKGNAGLIGYLYFLAGSHPKAFAELLGRTLPYQINTNSASTVGTVNIVSIPVGRFLDAADISKLTPALVVENAIENAIVEDEQRDDQDLDDPGAGQPHRSAPRRPNHRTDGQGPRTHPPNVSAEPWR
jgi:hypothetical protein